MIFPLCLHSKLKAAYALFRLRAANSNSIFYAKQIQASPTIRSCFRQEVCLGSSHIDIKRYPKITFGILYIVKKRGVGRIWTDPVPPQNGL